MWYAAAPKTHLTTNCKIDNDVDRHSVSVGKLFAGSGKEYKELKER